MADPNYAQISLELFSDDALLRFVLVHAKGERNSRIVDERDVGRDGRNERNAPHRQEQFGPDFHRPPRKGWASPRDIRSSGEGAANSRTSDWSLRGALAVAIAPPLITVAAIAIAPSARVTLATSGS